MKESADDNFKLDENGRMFAKSVENTGGKGEIAHYTFYGKEVKRTNKIGFIACNLLFQFSSK